MVSLGFVIFAMIEFALVLLLNRRSATKTSAEDKQKLFRKNDVVDIKIMNPKARIQPFQKKITTQDEGFKFVMPPTHVVDIVAFWFHLLSFVFYNVIYWNENVN